MRTRALTTTATAALLLVVVSGCADADPVADPTRSIGPSPSTSQTPTLGSPGTSDPTSSSPAPDDNDVATRAASTTVRQYFAAVDKVRQNANQPVSTLGSLATGTELAAQKAFLRKQRGASRSQTGDLLIRELSVESVNLTTPATVEIHVCWDVRGVDVLDSRGKSVVTAARTPVGWTSLTVTNPRFDRAPVDGWRVSGSFDLKAPPCAAS